MMSRTIETDRLRLRDARVPEHLAVSAGWTHHADMRAYAVVLRRKVVEIFLRGMLNAEAARTLGIGISIVKRYLETAHKGEDLLPRRHPGTIRKLDEVRVGFLVQHLKEHATATSFRRREYLARVAEVSVSESTIFRAIERL
jgi:transposase